MARLTIEQIETMLNIYVQQLTNINPSLILNREVVAFSQTRKGSCNHSEVSVSTGKWLYYVGYDEMAKRVDYKIFLSADKLLYTLLKVVCSPLSSELWKDFQKINSRFGAWLKAETTEL